MIASITASPPLPAFPTSVKLPLHQVLLVIGNAGQLPRKSESWVLQLATGVHCSRHDQLQLLAIETSGKRKQVVVDRTVFESRPIGMEALAKRCMELRSVVAK